MPAIAQPTPRQAHLIVAGGFWFTVTHTTDAWAALVNKHDSFLRAAFDMQRKVTEAVMSAWHCVAVRAAVVPCTSFPLPQALASLHAQGTRARWQDTRTVHSPPASPFS